MYSKWKLNAWSIFRFQGLHLKCSNMGQTLGIIFSLGIVLPFEDRMKHLALRVTSTTLLNSNSLLNSNNHICIYVYEKAKSKLKLDALMLWCPDALMLWCFDALMLWCFDFQKLQKHGVAKNLLGFGQNVKTRDFRQKLVPAKT